MAYFMIGVITDGKQTTGYRLVDTRKFSINSVKAPYKNTSVEKVKSFLGLGHTIENLRNGTGFVPFGEWDTMKISSIGSIDRYTKLSLSGNALTGRTYTVIAVSGAKVLLCDAFGNLINTTTNELYKERDKVKLTNARLTLRGDKIVISSLSGGELIRLEELSSNYKNISSNSSRKYHLPVDKYKKPMLDNWYFEDGLGNKLLALGLSFNRNKFNKNMEKIYSKIHLCEEVDIHINGPLLSFDGYSIISNNQANTTTGDEGCIQAHAIYVPKESIGRDTKSLRFIGVTEFYHKRKYLLLTLGVLNAFLHQYLILTGIIHIGKGMISVGLDNRDTNEDSTFIGLGLTGILMIEYRLFDSGPKSFWWYDVRCVPYSQLQTKEQVISALCTLKGLNRASITDKDINSIIREAKKSKFEFSITEDIHKLALHPVFEGSEYAECRENDAIIRISNIKVGMVTDGTYICSADKFIKGAIKNELSIYTYGGKNGQFVSMRVKGEEPNNKIYARHDFDTIRVDKHNFIGGNTALKIIGYIGLKRLGIVDEIRAEWVDSNTLKMTGDLIKSVSLSGNVLEVGYESYKLEFDYAKLLGHYESDMSHIAYIEPKVVRGNAKNALLGLPFNIDSSGIITDSSGVVDIRQSDIIKGIDMSSVSGELTIEITDDILLWNKYGSGRYRENRFGKSSLVNILLNAENFDTCCRGRIHTKGEVIINKFILDFSNVNTLDLLRRMLNFYVASRLNYIIDKGDNKCFLEDSRPRDMEYWIEKAQKVKEILKHTYSVNKFLSHMITGKQSAIVEIDGVGNLTRLTTMECINMDKVDNRLRVQILKQLYDSLSRVNGHKKASTEMLLWIGSSLFGSINQAKAEIKRL